MEILAVKTGDVGKLLRDYCHDIPRVLTRWPAEEADEVLDEVVDKSESSLCLVAVVKTTILPFYSYSIILLYS